MNNLFFIIKYCNANLVQAGTAITQNNLSFIDVHRLIYITKGKGHIRHKGKTHPFMRDTLIYYNSELANEADIIIEEACSYLIVQFNLLEIGHKNDSFVISGNQPQLNLNIVTPLFEGSSILVLFGKMIKIWGSKLPGYDFETKTLFQEILVTLYQNRFNSDTDYGITLRVRRVISYMRKNLDKKITLKELACRENISADYLSKIFKKVSGYSPIQYFNKIRIDKSKVLLLDENKKIKETALLLGFSDEFYFSRVFKRYEFISPSQFMYKNIHEN